MRLSDEQTCQLALRYTLTQLVEEARKRGAQSLVDIVSLHEDIETHANAGSHCHSRQCLQCPRRESHD